MSTKDKWTMPERYGDFVEGNKRIMWSKRVDRYTYTVITPENGDNIQSVKDVSYGRLPENVKANIEATGNDIQPESLYELMQSFERVEEGRIEREIEREHNGIVVYWGRKYDDSYSYSILHPDKEIENVNDVLYVCLPEFIKEHIKAYREELKERERRERGESIKLTVSRASGIFRGAALI